jgi:hypothetical protein
LTANNITITECYFTDLRHKNITQFQGDGLRPPALFEIPADIPAGGSPAAEQKRFSIAGAIALKRQQREEIIRRYAFHYQ